MIRHRQRVFSFLISALLIVTAAACDRLQSAMIQRMAARGLAGDRTDLLEDGKLHVVLCGTGSPIPDADRAGPCTAVLAGGHFVLVDVGPGSWKQVALERLPRAHLDAVLLTHFHSDHIGELGEVNMQSWVAGRTAPLTVYGPPGVEQVVDGFRLAYERDTEYRIAHHGVEAMPPNAGTPVGKTVDLPQPGESTLVFEADDLRITAFAVDHNPVTPAYGYRFDYRGRSAVVSGDTRKSPNVIKHAQGADLLVHEALAKRMIEPVTEYARANGLTRWAKLTSDVVTYHTSPIEAAEVAKAANVRALVLTHIVPPLPNFIAKRMFLRDVSSTWDGRVLLGTDGMEITLPPETTTVDVGSVG